MVNSNLGGNVTAAFTSLFLVVIALSPTFALGQVSVEDDWQSRARKVGLSDADIHRLDANRILITNESYKQVFVPYVQSWIPLFVTSDSLLNAYHALYEESIFRLEQAGTRQLPEILRFIMQNLNAVCEGIEGQGELVAPARQRATIVVGTALKLLDDEFSVDDQATTAIIDEERCPFVPVSARDRQKSLAFHVEEADVADLVIDAQIDPPLRDTRMASSSWAFWITTASGELVATWSRTKCIVYPASLRDRAAEFGTH